MVPSDTDPDVTSLRPDRGPRFPPYWAKSIEQARRDLESDVSAVDNESSGQMVNRRFATRSANLDISVESSSRDQDFHEQVVGFRRDLVRSSKHPPP